MYKVLVPVYQPVIDMVTGGITYHESLARRMDGAGGHGKLIELGESYGFIHLVDLGILAQVVRMLNEQPCVTVSVNVSVMTIENALPEFLSLVFAHMDVAPRIVFEITETVRARDFDKLDRFVEAIRVAGGRIAIDDFGDGFATMALVEHVKPEFVKFPAAMVEHLRATGDVQSLIDLRKEIESIGSAVIAEYIDSHEKYELLCRAGVRHGQGYYFGEPIQMPGCDRSRCPPDEIGCRAIRVNGHAPERTWPSLRHLVPAPPALQYATTG